jgi:adenylate cyclase
VNLAARMESGAKAYGVYTMVTESTKLACEAHGADRIVFRLLDHIVVKGRTQSVPVFEAVGLKEDLSGATMDCLRSYERGAKAYFARNWADARDAFKESSVTEPNQPGKTSGVETNPSLVMLARCEHLLLHAPAPDWDGVYVMTEK